MADIDCPHFDLPFRLGKAGANVVEQDSIEDVSNCVVAILSTHPGWRDEAPTFGTVDFAMRKMPLGAEDIATYVGSQEPRAIVVVDEHRDALDFLVARVNVGVSIYQKKGDQ